VCEHQEVRAGRTGIPRWHPMRGLEIVAPRGIRNQGQTMARNLQHRIKELLQCAAGYQIQ
ncbi:MAG: hypothetical protein QGH33_10740, partial [Pirellulaceae bacterium]|nr:hypothetical protein [Pirellulaceae bacterium]